jgi:hypothetical protein
MMTSGGNGGVGSGGDNGPGGNKKKLSGLSKEEHKEYVSKATKKSRLISRNLRNNSISLTNMLVIMPTMGHNCTFTVDPTPTAHNLPADGTNAEEREQYFYQSLHYNFHLWCLENGLWYKTVVRNGFAALFSKHPHLFGTDAIRSKLVLRFDLFTIGEKVWINEIHLFPEASPLLTDFPHEHIVLLKGWRQLIERTSEYISFMTTTAPSV